MNTITISPEIMAQLIDAQRNEATEAEVYKRVAKFIKNEKNREIVVNIGRMEETHANTWKSYTKQEVQANKLKVWIYTNVIRILGLTFGLKLMEKHERDSIINYDKLSAVIPKAKDIQKDEEEHEQQLLEMIDEKSLNYLGSIVLGLNDALVELTGVLAGLTFGLQNGKMIAAIGIITGISAAFSMAGSEYLSTKTDNDGNIKPITASVYTGIAYILTVILLILPYLLFNNIYVALAMCIATAIAIIAVFNYYTSVAKDHPFKSRFLEMAAISLSVAFISFIIGLIVKQVFDIDI